MIIIVLAILVVVLNVFFTFGSVWNDYSIAQSVWSGLGRIVVELTCLWFCAKGSRVAAVIVTLFWLSAAVVCVYLSFSQGDVSSRTGLWGVASIMFLMTLLLWRKKSKSPSS